MCPLAPAFEEDGWHSDELDEQIDVVIRNPEPPLRFVRPHSGLAEGSGLMGGGGSAEGRGWWEAAVWWKAAALWEGEALVEGPDAGPEPG